MASLRSSRRRGSFAALVATGFAFAGALGASATGCELVAGVDRTTIPPYGGPGGNGGAGGASTSTSTVTPTASSSSTGAGGACAVACTSPDACAVGPASCVQSACVANCCTFGFKPQGYPCAIGGGKVCDATGTCVQCLGPFDCTPTGTTCITPACIGRTCSYDYAVKGTPCGDHNGIVCNGTGTCVATHCMDGIKDADESDIDCGGSCAGCGNGFACKTAFDCASGICNGSNPGVCVGCNAPSDCPPTGDECVATTCIQNACGTQNLGASHVLSMGQTPHDCQSLVCNGKGGSVSIDDPTDLPLAALTACETTPVCAGSPLAPSYTPAPAGTDCSADKHPPNRVCGAGANAGLCVECNSSNDCAPASCNGSVFFAAATCDAAGHCAASGGVDCALQGKPCDPILGCSGCNAPGDCPPTGNECVVATCTQHVCGTQNLGPSHVLSTGQTSGDCQALVCNGAGGTKSIDDPTDLPTPTTVCKTSPACTGSPLAPSFTPAPTGTDCTADGHPPNHVCGDTSAPTLAGKCVQCTTSTDCLAINDAGPLTCNPANGTCQ